jgi:hypothetical protein
MTEPRKSEHYRKARQGKTYHGIASQKGGASAAAGRATYREEYQHDKDPHPDEPLNRTESEHEF